MTENKIAQTDYPVYELIKKRWSPYAYSNRAVDRKDLRSIFEAARWAPSSFNEQPWYYIVGLKENRDQFDKLLSCLVEGNQQWAKAAPVLALGIANTKFSRNGKPNRHAFHDLGQASAILTIEATARGLYVHQMAGIYADKVKTEFGLPENFEAVTALAIGYIFEADEAPEEWRKRDIIPRKRRPISESVFADTWGENHPLLID